MLLALKNCEHHTLLSHLPQNMWLLNEGLQWHSPEDYRAWICTVSAFRKEEGNPVPLSKQNTTTWACIMVVIARFREPKRVLENYKWASSQDLLPLHKSWYVLHRPLDWIFYHTHHTAWGLASTQPQVLMDHYCLALLNPCYPEYESHSELLCVGHLTDSDQS